MHIHILGICGTFMGSLALLAKEQGFTVTGSDQNVYPPMSTQLEQSDIGLHTGFDAEQLEEVKPDMVVVGNAMKRGQPVIEALLNSHIPYVSGPEFLARYILPNKHVLAVAGTHGKTTTTTMLAWILDQAGLNPGFLIGGVPIGFTQSARVGGDYFVVEADEYDSAFFDKRSKFVHYHPRTTILNNLEFDHADIFDDLKAIQKQFHHLIRTVPQTGLVIYPTQTPALDEVLEMGLWTPTEQIHPPKNSNELAENNLSQNQQPQNQPLHKQGWQSELVNADGTEFKVYQNGVEVGQVKWTMTGLHNVANAMAAIAASAHVGIDATRATQALSHFGGVKRRMELIDTVNGIDVYDDFAHHPTAIKTTLDGARKRIGDNTLWAIIEPRSNTMRLGSHKAELAQAAADADNVIWYQPKGMDWDLNSVVNNAPNNAVVLNQVEDIITKIVSEAKAGDSIVLMSNGGFEGIHQKLVMRLKNTV